VSARLHPGRETVVRWNVPTDDQGARDEAEPSSAE